MPDPVKRLGQYPHQLSGGLRQRVAIAVALAANPDVLIADEPTTALDVTIQAQILDLLERERTQRGMALLLITHDLGVVASVTDRVAVMYAGRVESGLTGEISDPPPPLPLGLPVDAARRLAARAPHADDPRSPAERPSGASGPAFAPAATFAIEGPPRRTASARAPAGRRGHP